MKFDFSGWATKVNLRCSDGRTIMKDAFKHNDGETVPLVWNHQHNNPNEVLGHALLENRDEGVYAYCTFNDTESGQTAKLLVQHGDVKALSIYANQLKEKLSNVIHGNIREVSLVLAGANPGAFIESIISHGEESEGEAIIYTGEDITLAHAEKAEPDEVPKVEETEDKPEEEPKEEETLAHANDTKQPDPKEKEKEKASEEKKDDDTETIADVFHTLTEKQKTVVYALIATALEEDSDDVDDEEKDKEKEKETAKDKDTDEDKENIKHSEGGTTVMKHNVFDKEDQTKTSSLSHADQQAIIDLAKSSGVGSLRTAMEIYAENNKDTLSHGIDDIELLFPDYKDVHPGAPELLERDQSWVGLVMRKAHKSPVSRVRTRQADARAAEVRAKGYNDRESAKTISANIKVIMRTTDPQTVYRRDALHRDDIVDITDFDVIAYQKTVMRHNLEEDIALAALVGDGRSDDDVDKISESHIRSVWHDDDLYTIKATVDIEAARTELQGTNTSAYFGDNFVYAEAVITASLYAREQYKGKGTLDFYCTPHLLNVMLLARDLNGRRIYDTKEDLAKALNVGEIHTVEQFDGLTREDAEGNTKKLLGIFVNMANYQFGCTKGGEITNFEDFDIDFNQFKYLMETRLSGALTQVYSAIALEESVSSEEVAG